MTFAALFLEYGLASFSIARFGQSSDIARNDFFAVFPDRLIDQQCLCPVADSLVRILSQLLAARAVHAPSWNGRMLDRVEQHRQTILLTENGVHRGVLDLRRLGLPGIEQQRRDARVVDRRQSLDGGNLQVQRLSRFH